MAGISQEKFDRLFRQSRANVDVCVFPECKERPILAIRRRGRDYGVCERGWDIIAESDVEWGE